MPHNISHLRNNSNGDFENHRKHIIPKRKRTNRAVYEKFKDGTIKGISGEIPFEISDGSFVMRRETGDEKRDI